MNNYQRLCKKFMSSFVQNADTLHAFAKTRRASCVAKKCQERRKLDFLLPPRTNTSAECVRIWMTQKSPWATAVAHDPCTDRRVRSQTRITKKVALLVIKEQTVTHRGAQPTSGRPFFLELILRARGSYIGSSYICYT